MPYWHQVGDTFDKIDPEALGRASAFTAAFLAAVDARAADEGVVHEPRLTAGAWKCLREHEATDGSG